MCFSSSVSFGASAFLMGAGIASLKKTESPKMMAFASLPIIFGVQQLSEAILWLSFSNSELDSWHNTSIYLFIFFAQVIWPIWIPFAVWLMEPDKTRKKILFYFMLLGWALSLYILYCLFAYEVSADIEGTHIRYQLHFPNLVLRRSLIFLTSIVPVFLSSLKRMKLLGVALLGSLILTFIFYTQYIISMWCFFAALLSAVVILVVIYNKESAANSAMV